MSNCPTCGAIVYGDGMCVHCATDREARFQVSGHDPEQVAQVLERALVAEKKAKLWGRIGIIGAIVAGTAAVLANLAQILAFLGFGATD